MADESKIEAVKKILVHLLVLQEIDDTSYQSGINATRNLNEAAQEIDALYSQDTTCPECKGTRSEYNALAKEIVNCHICHGTGKVAPKPFDEKSLPKNPYDMTRDCADEDGVIYKYENPEYRIYKHAQRDMLNAGFRKVEQAQKPPVKE